MSSMVSSTEYKYSCRELQALAERQDPDHLSHLREQDTELWWWMIEPNYRQMRIQEEAGAPEKAAKPNAPKLPERGRPSLEWATALVREIKEFVARSISAETGRFADAGRVVEMADRIADLERRLAGLEGRIAVHDTAIAAHRKHLSNLEIAKNDLKRALAGEPPTGEKRER